MSDEIVDRTRGHAASNAASAPGSAASERAVQRLPRARDGVGVSLGERPSCRRRPSGLARVRARGLRRAREAGRAGLLPKHELRRQRATPSGGTDSGGVRALCPAHLGSISVHGKVEVVVMSAEEFRRLKGERTGAALIEALQASPSRDVDLTPVRAPMPVRTIEL